MTMEKPARLDKLQKTHDYQNNILYWQKKKNITVNRYIN